MFLVIDAMIGQDAVRTAKAFDERLDLSGVILTKLDGDARGGAALSIKAATGKPIKFLGMGESLDKLEEFRPEGLAGRILGMGDLVGLMEDFQEVVDEETAAKDAAKMLGGNFTMDDFLQQIKTIQSMGSLKDIMEKMPMASMFGMDIPQEALEKASDDKELGKVEAMIRSMSKGEREAPELFLVNSDENLENRAHAKLSRRKRRQAQRRAAKRKDPTKLQPSDFVGTRISRVARGSGHSEQEIRELIMRFIAMRDMFGQFGDLLGGIIPGFGPGGGGGGFLDKIPGGGMLKQLNSMRKLAKNPEALQQLMGSLGGGGLPGMGGMGGMPPGFPGMGGGMGGMPPGFPGMGGGAAGGPPPAPKRSGSKKRKPSKGKKKRR